MISIRVDTAVKTSRCVGGKGGDERGVEKWRKVTVKNKRCRMHAEKNKQITLLQLTMYSYAIVSSGKMYNVYIYGQTYIRVCYICFGIS